MEEVAIPCRDPARLGRSLRGWRALRRVKQNHAAELLGVTQATVSRWESGQLTPDSDGQRAIRRLLQARLDSAADFELARMVRRSTAEVHLVCDLTHRLLALSPARERLCRVPASELMGTSLWPCASPGIIAAETRLGELGWFEPAAPAVELQTGANDGALIQIRDSRLRWVRFQLSDGSFVRLAETLAPAPAA
ncbi:helix-turn-helix transcriptional regulator [Geminicoccus flavidas]|uniref:helix-turn-helix transcriptional regulator n=1 Tax=Geminicoccus flavidas TaxID=2506407 RepID=UPI0013577A64|nr:helix-turn-helix transcriptional regulator [Geminicoccus flavidas]